MIFAKPEYKEPVNRIFRRIATALLFEKAVREYEEALEWNGQKIVDSLLKPVGEKVKALQKYIHKYGAASDRRTPALEEEILKKAEETNDWDLTYWAEYKYVKSAVEQLDFLPLLESSNKNDKNMSKFINQVLLFRKMKYPEKYENLEACVVNGHVIDDTIGSVEEKEEVIDNDHFDDIS